MEGQMVQMMAFEKEQLMEGQTEQLLELMMTEPEKVIWKDQLLEHLRDSMKEHWTECQRE